MTAPIVGIDLGTTNSLIAYMKDGKPTVIPITPASNLLPSVVHAAPDGTIMVGWEAKAHRVERAEETAFSFKRFMGKGPADLGDEAAMLPYRIDTAHQEILRIVLNGREYTPIELSAFVLKTLKQAAEARFGEPVTRAVVTVPAYFNDAQRQATKLAGKLAGLEVLRIVNEPTAAALAYGLQRRNHGHVAVYDFGGGTFDISILNIQDGVFQVLSTCGNTALGGDDIDEALMTYFLAELEREVGVTRADLDRTTLQQLRDEAEQAKIRLTDAPSTTIVIQTPGADHTWELTRAQFNDIIRPVVERTMGPVKQAVKDSKLSAAAVDEVILVGGSTRVPLVRERVAEFFGKAPHCELNPEETVAMGAAIQADIMAGMIKDMLLLDVTPLSLGIEAFGGTMSVLISRNTPVPVSVKEGYTTFVDNQTGIDINIFQGERELVKDNRPLGRFQLKGITPQPAGLPRIEVTFTLDANGILAVTAKDLRTGKEAYMEVTPTYGITEAEVERLIMESIDHAEEDVKATLLISSRQEAATVLRATRLALAAVPPSGTPHRGDSTSQHDHADQLTPEEAAAIPAAVAALDEAVSGTDHNAIIDRIKALNGATHALAERRMNQLVHNALTRRDVDTIL